MNTLICPHCNSENSAESVNCQVCGSPIQDSLLSQAAQGQALPTERNAEQTSPTPSAGSDEHNPAGIGEESRLSQKAKASEDNLDEWLRELPAPTTGELGLRGRPRDTDGALPTWLQEVRATADEQSPTSEPGLVDWLSGLEGEGMTPAPQGQGPDELPEWVSALTQPEKWPDADDPEAMADWFANTEEVDDHLLPQTSELPTTAPLGASRELDGIPEQLVGDSLPAWLMSEAGADDNVESADFLPSTREPLIRQHSAQVLNDGGDEADGFLSEPATNSEKLSTDDEPPVASVEQYDWLEEIEDQEIETALDEILLVDNDEINRTEFGASLDEGPAGDETIVEDHDLGNIVAKTLLLNELAVEDTESDPLLQEDLPLIGPGAEEQEVETIYAEISPPESMVDEVPASSPGEWLGYLEDTPETQISDSFGEATLRSDIDLEPAEIPEWLRAMKPDESGLSKSSIMEEDQEKNGPLAGLRGVVPLAVAATGSGQIARPAKFETTKEQQQQIALLRQLTLTLPEEPGERIISGATDRFVNERLVLGLLLLLVVLLGYFLPFERWLPFLSEWTISENTESAYQVLDQVGDKSVLLAFEYTPAMAGELDVIADSVLVGLADNNASIFTISQAAAGVVMAQNAVERADIEQAYDLGFLPGDAAGLRGLGYCLAPGNECNSIVGLPLDDEIAPLLENVALIVILTGDRDSLVNWIEQVGSQTEVPLIVGLAQSLGPVATPYLLSDQLAGLIEGAPAASTYEYSLAGTDQQDGQLLRAFTLGQYLFIAVLIAGVLFFGLLKRPTKPSGQAGTRGY